MPTTDVQKTSPQATPQANPKAKAGEHASGDRRFKSLDMAMKRNQYQPDALIEVLHKAQETFGFLEEDVLLYVARGLKLPLSKVYGVATFYHLFSLKPSGKHTCVVCLGTACYVKGSSKIAESLVTQLKTDLGKTTADGQVSLMAARCVGACGGAPVVVMDGTVQSKQEPETVLAQVMTWMTEET
ncbi:MAG: bidirectional hydrogenase complex protein HoxE [Pseudanabaenaceae cyanobacterium]|jgi:bidirectional [NiFe] hydrogenase diaphorase subunit